jgi:hypothetical protein
MVGNFPLNSNLSGYVRNISPADISWAIWKSADEDLGSGGCSALEYLV